MILYYPCLKNTLQLRRCRRIPRGISGYNVMHPTCLPSSRAKKKLYSCDPIFLFFLPNSADVSFYLSSWPVFLLKKRVRKATGDLLCVRTSLHLMTEAAAKAAGPVWSLRITEPWLSVRQYVCLSPCQRYYTLSHTHTHAWIKEKGGIWLRAALISRHLSGLKFNFMFSLPVKKGRLVQLWYVDMKTAAWKFILV